MLFDSATKILWTLGPYNQSRKKKYNEGFKILVIAIKHHENVVHP